MKYGIVNDQGKWVERAEFGRTGIGCEVTLDPKAAMVFEKSADAEALIRAFPTGGGYTWVVKPIPESFDGNTLRMALSVLLGSKTALSNEAIFDRLSEWERRKPTQSTLAHQTASPHKGKPCPHCGGKGAVNVARGGVLVNTPCSPCKGAGY